MKFKIDYKDTKGVVLLKIIYLLPYVLIAYIPVAIHIGMKKLYNPITELIDTVKERPWR